MTSKKLSAKFSKVLNSYKKYLDSIDRSEMFDAYGNYNETLKKYHSDIESLAKNDIEKMIKNFLFSFL